MTLEIFVFASARKNRYALEASLSLSLLQKSIIQFIDVSQMCVIGETNRSGVSEVASVQI